MNTTTIPRSRETTSSVSPVRRPPPVTLPVAPEGFRPLSKSHFGGAWPRLEELAVLADAVRELARFEDYTSVLGGTVPTHEVTLQIFQAADEWSSLRSRLREALVYAQDEESRAWVQLRALMKHLKWGLDAAVRMYPALGDENPSLRRLLSVKGEIAARGVTSRRANREEIAAGRPPYKGEAGKLRQRKAAKAAVAAAEEKRERGPSNG